MTLTILPPDADPIATLRTICTHIENMIKGALRARRGRARQREGAPAGAGHGQARLHCRTGPVRPFRARPARLPRTRARARARIARVLFACSAAMRLPSLLLTR